MTQPNPISNQLSSLASVKSGARLRISESNAVISCLREIELIVISTPSVVDYINYIAHKKAELLLPELDSSANKIIDLLYNIKKIEDTLSTTLDEDSQLFYEQELEILENEYNSEVKSYNETYNRYGSLVSNVSTDMLWVLDYRERYQNTMNETELSNPTLSQAARAHLACVPQELSTEKVQISDHLVMRVDGTTGSILYESSTLNPANLVCVGDIIGGSTVISVTDSGFILDAAPTAEINNTVHFRFAREPKNNIRLRVSKDYLETVTGILSSPLKIDLQTKAVKSLVRGYKLRDIVNTSTYTTLEIHYPKEVSAAYDQIKRSVRKWNAVHLLDLIILHNIAVPTVRSLHKARLEESLSRAATLLDTRSSV